MRGHEIQQISPYGGSITHMELNFSEPPCRSTWIDRIVPFDAAIPFHMMVASIGGLLAVVHAISHIIDYAHAVGIHR